MTQSYQSRKVSIAVYRKKNRLKINEWRRRYQNPNGREKSFSFVRDFLHQLSYLDTNDKIKQQIYQILFSLKLTNRQHVFLQEERQGLTQEQIAAKYRVNQSTVCKVFNGKIINGKVHGGIFKKFMKYLSKNSQFCIQMAELPTSHLLSQIWCKVVVQIPLQVNTSRAELLAENAQLKYLLSQHRLK